MRSYRDAIDLIREDLKVKTIDEIEKEKNIQIIDYQGIGFGYNLKSHYPKTIAEARQDIETPLWDELEKLLSPQTVKYIL